MIELTLFGLAVTVVTTVCGVVSWWGVLRLMDRAAGIDFRERVDEGLSTPDAVYFGLRAIAVAYLMAALWSRFI